MERYFAQSHDGVRIRYGIRGAGAPLALVMGFGGSMRNFGEPFIQLIARVFKTILIDNGYKEKSPDPAPDLRVRSLREAADWIIGLQPIGSQPKGVNRCE